MNGTQNILGRLAFRVEGEMWNAYWAPELDRFDGAVLMGSLRMTLAQHPVLKNAFMDLMKAAFNHLISDIAGKTVDNWSERTAPERERAGRA